MPYKLRPRILPDVRSPVAGGVERLPARIIGGFGLGQFGVQICRDIPATLLLFFLTQVLAIPPGISGVTVLVPKIWVVVGDLIVGVVSDRTTSRWGRRRPYLLVGAVVASIGLTWLFWAPDTLSPWTTSLYVGGVYLILCTGQSLYGVPYLAMASEVTANAAERVRLLAIRQICLLAGVFVAIAGAPLVIEGLGGGLRGYRIMALGLGPLVATAMLAPVFTVPTVATSIRVSSASVRKDMRSIRKDRAFVLVIAANIAQSIAIGASSSAAPYYVTQAMGYDFRMYSAFASMSIVGALVSQVIWVKISQHLGRTRTYMIALAGHGGFTAIMLGTWVDPAPVLLTLGFILGIFSAGLSLLSVSLLTDVVHTASRASGGREALMSAFYTISERTSVAVGAFLVAGILSLGGYVESHGGSTMQTSHALRFVRYAFAVVPPSADFLSLCFAWVLHHEMRP